MGHWPSGRRDPGIEGKEGKVLVIRDQQNLKSVLIAEDVKGFRWAIGSRLCPRCCQSYYSKVDGQSQRGEWLEWGEWARLRQSGDPGRSNGDRVQAEAAGQRHEPPLEGLERETKERSLWMW